MKSENTQTIHTETEIYSTSNQLSSAMEVSINVFVKSEPTKIRVSSLGVLKTQGEKALRAFQESKNS